MIKKNKPRVSVIIPVYNAEKFISKTIDSVIAQTFSDWEIIAVDDGSVDRSPQILKKYSEKMPKKIKVITQKNKGVSIARNKAISAAKGEFIACLDQDDLWLPTKLEEQIRVLESNGEVGMVYCDSYVIDENGKIIKKSVMESILSRSFIRPKKFRGDIFDELFCVNFISLETVVVRKSVLKKVGLFNPKFKIAEDYDLFLRIAREYPIEFIPKQLSMFRAHPRGASRNVELRVLEEFEILEWWIQHDLTLRNRLQKEIKLKKLNLHASMIKYQLAKGNLQKILEEVINFLRTWQ